MNESPYTLVDIGANLTHPTFNNRDLENVIERTKAAGVKRIMVTGTSVEHSKEALRLTRFHPGYLFCTAGVHPHDAKTFTDDTIRELESLARNPECVAIGECGLDFNRNFSPQEDQLRAFREQVALACRLKKPLFVHEREAANAMVEILESFAGELPPTVIHCFTGTIVEATRYINMGLYIGLTGFLWKDRSDDGVQAALRGRHLPLERLMLETDAPFMYPNVIKCKKLPKDVGERISERSRSFLARYCTFQRNEPCALPAIVELVAAFMDEPPENVAFNTTVNAMKVFGLGSDTVDVVGSQSGGDS